MDIGTQRRIPDVRYRAVIIDVNPDDGAVQLDLRPGKWLPLADQLKKLVLA